MTHRRARSAAIVAAATAAALSIVGSPSADANHAAAPAASKLRPSPMQGDVGAREQKGYYDARHVSGPSAIRGELKTVQRSTGADLGALRTKAGAGAAVTIDPLTGTPSNYTSMTDFLTAPSNRSAQSVALSYLSANAAALGLQSSDVSTFHLQRDYVDVGGTHHISWVQRINGVQVFGNGLKANVTKQGELVSLQGSPVSGATALAGAASTSDRVSASAARNSAARDVGGQADASASEASRGGTAKWSNGDQAHQVWFLTPSGLRLAWWTYTQAGDGLVYSHVIDAQSGKVLYRANLVNNDKGDALVYDYYPGAARGGKARVVNLIDKGWLGPRVKWLNGAYASAWADVDDDNLPGSNEKTAVPGKRKAQFKLVPFHANPLCSSDYKCTWRSNTPFSWRTNKRADVTNAFYLASRFHDYLKNSVIGFTPAAGNFERADGDQVKLNALDGANTASGLPDGNHIDNANMATPPDGIPPTMQMYLWHQPYTSNDVDPFLPVSGAFDASILFHEFTHGLSNRLVVDADGNGALNGIQPGSMGEAWSDYYAMDFLVKKGFQPDNSKRDGQIREGKYVLADQFPFRTMAMDCPVNATAKNCTQLSGVKGGYTYGDFPTIGGSPEVHSSGEVWAQTLWDLREALGTRTTDNLVTRAMELSPPEPSMLDMRNAILQADKINYANAHTSVVWRVFAHRGMGWYAGAFDGSDAYPVEDFHKPPSALRTGTLYGLVVDPTTGNRVPDATVAIGGHSEYSDTTGSNGVYQIDNIRVGRYPKIIVKAPGYEIATTAARVTLDAVRKDFEIRRDWAALSGGAELADFNGPDYTSFGCGPGAAIDLSQSSGWGSTTGDDAGTPTATPIPKYVVAALPEPIDIAAGTDPDAGTAFKVDPSNTCGDPGSSSTNEYRIQVSTNGTAWITVQDGAFGTVEDPDSTGHFFDVASTRSVSGVRYVRFWMDSPQVPDIATNCPDGAFGGCTFMDMREFEVFGLPAS